MGASDDGRRPAGPAASMALTLGVAALVCAVIPVVGDLVSVPVALAALAFGWVASRRLGRGGRGHVRATFGIILAALALLVVAILALAAHAGP